MVRNALSLIDNFNQLTPYAVGFERQFNRLNDYWNHQQQSTGFPPYNIQKVTDEFTKKIDELLTIKNKDIMTV